MTADDFTPAESLQADEYEAIRFEDEPRDPRNLVVAILAAGFAVACVAGVWRAWS